MTKVVRYGVSAEPIVVDVIDELCESILAASGPSTNADQNLLSDAMWKGLVVRFGIDDVVEPTLHGLVVSTYWESLWPLVREYLAMIAREYSDGRDRSRVIEWRVPAYLNADMLPLLAYTIHRHQWSGTEFAVEEQTLRLRMPPHVRAMLDLASLKPLPMESLLSRSEVSTHRRLRSLHGSRSYAALRAEEAALMAPLVSDRLRHDAWVPRSVSVWVRSILHEYVQEADTALRGGACLAAIVLYGAAVEVVLACRYSSLPTSLDGVAPKDLELMFKAKSLFDSLSTDPEVLGRVGFGLDFVARLSRLRELRNSVHANRYAEARAVICVRDALEFRECLLKLSTLVG
jgi:hypothetical protein